MEGITYEEVMSLMKYHHDKIKNSEYWINFDPCFFDEVKKSFQEIVSLIIAPSFRQKMEIYHKPYTEIFVYGNKYYPILSVFIHDVNYYCSRGKYVTRSSDNFDKMLIYLQTFLSAVHMCIDNVDNPEIKEPGFDFYTGVRQYTEDGHTGYYKVQIYKTQEAYDRLLNYYKKKIGYEYKRNIPDKWLLDTYVNKLNSLKEHTNPSYILDL